MDNNGGTNELMLYAPDSELELAGNATWIGMFAGKTVLTTRDRQPDDQIGSVHHAAGTIDSREPARSAPAYVECTGATASPPNASC